MNSAAFVTRSFYPFEEEIIIPEQILTHMKKLKKQKTKYPGFTELVSKSNVHSCYISP